MHQKIAWASVFAVSLLLTPTVSQAQWLDKLNDVKRAVEGATDDVTKGQSTQPSAPSPSQAQPQQQQQPTGFNSDRQLTEEVQRQLRRLGYPVGVDGVYGPGTRAAIMAFEQSNDMQVTGNVTPQLVLKLQTAPAQQQGAGKPAAQQAAGAEPTASASDDDRNVALVSRVQRELKRLGYALSVDGAYGPMTRKAIMSFQKSENLPVTGNVSPELVAYLEAKAPAAQNVAQPQPQPKAEPAPGNAAVPMPASKPDHFRGTEDDKGYEIVKYLGHERFRIYAAPDRIVFRREHATMEGRKLPRATVPPYAALRFDGREIGISSFPMRHFVPVEIEAGPGRNHGVLRQVAVRRVLRVQGRRLLGR